jgi:DNA-binding NarL/FixJ family response regulator
MTADTPIKVLIADDHTLVRQAWSIILDADPRFSVVADCGTSRSCIQLAHNLKPDVILLDIHMPGMNGIEAIPHILQQSPSSKILGISFHTNPSYARRMLREGAKGYVTKNSSKDELITAIVQVHEGTSYICQEIKEALSHELYGTSDLESRLGLLSKREIEIISWVRRGYQSKDIAVELSIAPKTVEVHRYNILQKLRLKNSAELVNYCNQHNLDMDLKKPVQEP